MDRLHLMEVFVAIVNAGHLSRAAEQLGMSRAAVSKQLQVLELHIGARLLERTTRRLSLTHSGRIYFERAMRILSDIESAELAAGLMHREPRGELRVVAPPNFGIPDLGAAIAEFLLAYPRMRVSLSFNDRHVDLMDGHYDVAIRMGDPKDSSFSARKLNHSRRVLCAAPGYLVRRGVPSEPQELTEHDCICYAYMDEPIPWSLKGPQGVEVVPVTPRLITSHSQLLRAAMLRELGIVMGPAIFFEEDIASGRAQRILPQYECPDAVIYSISAPGRHMSAKIRAFNEFMARHFASRFALAADQRAL